MDFSLWSLKYPLAVYEEQQRNQQGNSVEYAKQIKLKKDGGQKMSDDSAQKGGCCGIGN